MSILRRARSLCPECLRVINAQYVSDAEAKIVRLEKTCPEHGTFRTPAWVEKNGAPAFEAWRNDTPPSYPSAPSTTCEKGCPFDCGLCPEHAQKTCCALVELTRRCNMNCPLCYASSGENEDDPGMELVADMLSTLRAHEGQANVQLSGGEPTVRDDLPEIIRLAHEKGFPFVQLNTNGLRLAREAAYAGRLKEAGLDLVYLQWDGMRESTFTRLRGAPYLTDKERAARNCIEAGLPVVLVATVVRGVNDDELGDLLRKALSFGEYLRGVHLQPAAFFGRYPWKKEEVPRRLTLPELMHALETQSKGMILARHFRPPNSEHALCSFSALYQRLEEGGLQLVAGEHGCCAPHDEAQRAKNFVARHWGAFAAASEPRNLSDGFDAFLAASSLRRRFTLSAMAFQDAYSLDLDRARRCHVHIVTRDRRLAPFCMYNMTSASGVPLYRTI